MQHFGPSTIRVADSHLAPKSMCTAIASPPRASATPVWLEVKLPIILVMIAI